MSCMFDNSEFNQDISNWDVSNETTTNRMFDKSSIKEEYKPKTLQK